MTADPLTNPAACSRQEVSEFQQGELSPVDEARVQGHLANCSECTNYLNSLKLVSTSLEIFLDKDPVRIPEHFSKTVKTAAESDTAGIRSQKERYRAVAVTAFLFCVAAVLLTVDASAMAPGVRGLSGSIIAAGGIAGHFLYAVSMAFSFLASSFCSKFLFSSAIAVFSVLTLLGICLYVFSKHIAGSQRL